MRLLLPTLVTALLALGASALELARDGRAGAVIVAPAYSPAPVRFAASELKHYLDRITGADFAIVEEVPASGAAIVLGESLANIDGLKREGLGRDGYLMKTVGDRLYVFGKDSLDERANILFTVDDGPLPETATSVERNAAFGELAWDFERGTLHGVYALLEELGVRWFFPGPHGEVVPWRPTVVVDPLDVRAEPYFWLRVDGRIILPIPHYVKLGVVDPEEYAMLELDGRQQRLWTVRMRASSQWLGFNHRPARSQWHQRFAADHPDYFALQPDGSRALGDGRQQPEYLNYTSPGVLEETVADVLAYFRGESAASRGIDGGSTFALNNGWNDRVACGDFFSLLPNDGLRADHSPESLKYIDEGAPLPQRHTNYIWQFVDKVGRQVQPEFPNKYVYCLAYQSYWEVPTVVEKLPPNVVAGIAALSGPSRVNNSVPPDQFAYFTDLVERWDAMSDAPLFFWSYWLTRYKSESRKAVPALMPHHAQRWLQLKARHGRWLFMQHDMDNMIMEHINRYVVHRLMWDPNVNVDDILVDYLDSFYGPAAPPMGEILADMEQRCTEIAATRADHITVWEHFFTGEVLARYRELIDAAAAAAKGTRHADAVHLMDVRWIGQMEAARARYVADIQTLRAEGADLVLAGDPGPVEIDGKVTEKTWKDCPRRPFYSNQTGAKVGPPITLRTILTDDTLYACWQAKDDRAKAGEPPPGTSVELFADPDPDTDGYYQVWLSLDGKLQTWFYPAPGEPGDPNWDSQLEYAIGITDGGWVVEMALPLAAMAEKHPAAADFWRVNFCRTIPEGDDPRQRFATVNPILRGSFGQPALFARLRRK